jgi:tetratricopeptide (TPR) repeat protein
MAKKSRTRKRLSRLEIRDLDIEIGFLQGLLARDANYLDVLRLLSDDYLLKGDFQKGLELDEKLIEIDSQNSQAFFNLACSYALTGQFRGAVDALSLAIDRGYEDWKWIAREASFEAFRQSSEYQEVLEKIQLILTPTSQSP